LGVLKIIYKENIKSKGEKKELTLKYEKKIPFKYIRFITTIPQKQTSKIFFFFKITQVIIED
jgi:hypothetical protein